MVLKPSLLIVAGDVVDKGGWQHAGYLEEVYDICEPAAFLGVFGNDDYTDVRDKIKELAPRVVWLEDEKRELNIEGSTISVYGSTGILDEPTRWQERNISSIREIYAERLERLKSYCEQLSPQHINIVVMHYPPTYSTLRGEPAWAWRQMGSRRAEGVLASTCGRGYVFHGHAHNSVNLQSALGNIAFFNVSYPARKDLLYVELRPKVGLERFLAGETK